MKEYIEKEELQRRLIELAEHGATSGPMSDAYHQTVLEIGKIPVITTNQPNRLIERARAEIWNAYPKFTDYDGKYHPLRKAIEILDKYRKGQSMGEKNTHQTPAGQITTKEMFQKLMGEDQQEPKLYRLTEKGIKYWKYEGHNPPRTSGQFSNYCEFPTELFHAFLSAGYFEEPKPERIELALSDTRKSVFRVMDGPRIPFDTTQLKDMEFALNNDALMDGLRAGRWDALYQHKGFCEFLDSFLMQWNASKFVKGEESQFIETLADQSRKP